MVARDDQSGIARGLVDRHGDRPHPRLQDGREKPAIAGLHDRGCR